MHIQENIAHLIKAGNKSLLTNSFFIFIIRFFPSLANLVVMIWYSRHLPQGLYGRYQNFWVQLYVIYPLACFGIHMLFITYSPAFIVKLLHSIKTKQYLFYLLWLISLGTVFAMLQCNSIPFIIPILFLLCFSLVIIFESFLIVFKDYISLIVVNIIFSVLYLGIHWYVLKHGFSLKALFTYLLIIIALRLCVYAGIVIKNIRKYSNNEIKETPSGKIRTLWLHLGLYDTIQVLFNYIDKFIISLVLSAQVSAIYFNGSQNVPFLPLLLSAGGSAVLIQLTRTNKKDEHTDIIQLMNQLGRILSCIVFPVFFFLFFFRNEFIIAIFSNKYISAIPVFMISILALPIRSYHFTTILQRLHKGNIINIGAIADLLLACGLMYPLYKFFGLPGVALSFVISTYLQASFYLFYSAKLLHVAPLKLIPYANWLIKLIVFASLFIIIHYAGNIYFKGKIALILGGIMMVIMIAVSLFFEFLKQRRYDRN